MTTVLNGLLGGLLAAVVAVAFWSRLREGPPLLAAVLATVGGGPASFDRRAGATLVVIGGALAGGGLVVVERYFLDALAVPPLLVEAIAVGAGWSVVLYLVAVAAWVAFVARPTDRVGSRSVAVAFVTYGLLLGLWIRFTWVT